MSSASPAATNLSTRDVVTIGLAFLGTLGLLFLGIAAAPLGRRPAPRLIQLGVSVRPAFGFAGLWLISAAAILYLVVKLGG